MNLNTRNFLELKGNRIYLKKLDKVHIEEYWEAFKESSVEAMLFTGTQQVFNKSSIERHVENISVDGSRVDFFIRTKESNKIVGEVVLNDIDRNNRSASTRIVLYRKENFSKGYGSEALVLALNYGFGMLNLHRIELEVLPINQRGIKAYEKIGFTREGIKREAAYYHNQYYDMITMSLLAKEFREKYINEKESLERFL